MPERAAFLVDEVLPHEPMRQWVRRVPFSLRFLFERGALVHTISQRVARFLERKGVLLEQDAENSYLALVRVWRTTR